MTFGEGGGEREIEDERDAVKGELGRGGGKAGKAGNRGGKVTANGDAICRAVAATPRLTENSSTGTSVSHSAGSGAAFPGA